MIKVSKKRTVLIALFILPLVFFLVLSTGINNFKKLPIVTQEVFEINTSKVQLKNHISVVCFLGSNIDSIQGGVFNLNQKIYKPFFGFTDFQMIGIYPKDQESKALKLKKKLGEFTDMSRWKFIGLLPDEIENLHKSFNTRESLKNLYSSRAFIIDKNLNLRGRVNDEDSDNGILYGYNMISVAELNNKMKDDVKIVLAEYRLALKQNKRKI